MYTIYSKPNCPFCDKAKMLLQMKGLEFTELVVDVGQDKDPKKTYVTLEKFKEVTNGAKAVPQIFNEDQLIGGYTDLQKSLA